MFFRVNRRIYVSELSLAVTKGYGMKEGARLRYDRLPSLSINASIPSSCAMTALVNRLGSLFYPKPSG